MLVISQANVMCYMIWGQLKVCLKVFEIPKLVGFSKFTVNGPVAHHVKLLVELVLFCAVL